jgi:5-methylcytosine-specific restriction endonuclease McrA
MTIRPENKQRYPKDWYAISVRIRQRAGNRCEECGVENHALGGRTPEGGWLRAQPTGTDGMNLTWPRPGELAWCGGTFTAVLLRIVRIVLTVAHLNHTPEDCRDENLKAMCQRCHNRYDAAERRRGMRSRAHAARAAGDFFSGW